MNDSYHFPSPAERTFRWTLVLRIANLRCVDSLVQLVAAFRFVVHGFHSKVHERTLHVLFPFP
jgi:hypothetical protein